MTVLVGLGAGVAGALLALLLHGVQHVAYGYVRGPFLAGVEAASPVRRVVVMGGAGVLAGAGWWALYRFGRPLVSIAAAVRSQGNRMPPLTTLCHALLQIVTVGLGSPLGREVAPREVAALVAGELTRRLGLSPRQCGTLIACAAGAGLAAVYDVPLGGAVFTLEVLLGSWALGAVLPAVATAVIATMVSWLVLPDEAVYQLPQLAVGTPLIVWSALVGPVVGVCAYGFSRLAAAAGE
ncbi:chloride channel protein, partial [Streptomyces sp. T-3]|nr:chloride channel protein [Streptomyces sp. T-3]